MKTKKSNITSLEDLSAEIDNLYQRKDELNNQLNNNWNHLKNNFPFMLRNSLFRRSRENFHNSWAQTLFSIPKVQVAVGNTLEKISLKVEEVLLNWFDKTFIKKD